MTLFTFVLLLLSLPQPATATPAPTPKTAMPSTAAIVAGCRVDLLDCSSMALFLLLPSPTDADPQGALY